MFLRIQYEWNILYSGKYSLFGKLLKISCKYNDVTGSVTN
jgi:hypothetical protein